jgi:hypothetical protein
MSIRMPVSEDELATASTMINAYNVVDALTDGCVLEFSRTYDPGVDDIISFTLSGGGERVLVVQEPASPDWWIVSHMKGSFTTHLRHQRLDRRSFRVVLEPNHRDMPQAF